MAAQSRSSSRRKDFTPRFSAVSNETTVMVSSKERRSGPCRAARSTADGVTRRARNAGLTARASCAVTPSGSPPDLCRRLRQAWQHALDETQPLHRRLAGGH